MNQFIIISEPWDFTSSDGNNKIKVKKIHTGKEYLIYKCLSNYENMSNLLLLHKRDEEGNYNIYQISDFSIIDFNNLELAMIGKLIKIC